MPRLSRQVIIAHSPDQVFDLVADIERYPDFIKWIRSMKVTPSYEEGDVRAFRGEADVGFKGFSERFGTDVVANSKERSIKVDLAHGPFRHLRNRWVMRPDGANQTNVDFFIDYEFRNPVLSLLARANTSLAVSKIIEAFRAEADRRYGAPPR